jgi:hypothetical protein
VGDEQPTDDADTLLTALDKVAGVQPPPCLHAVCPAGSDAITMRGLGFRKVTWVGSPGTASMAGAMATAFLCDEDH